MSDLLCAKCPKKLCQSEVKDRAALPAFCPIKTIPAVVKKVSKRYKRERISNFYIRAAITERGCYDESEARRGRTLPVRPRIREIAEFAKAIRVKKLGLAFCNGLADEAGRAAAILEKHGIAVESVICCCGAVDKTAHGVPAKYKIKGKNRFEAACNPLLQAELLNRAGTDFNVLVGLCIGHDMLFTSNSRAPVTTLIVKDRLSGHNPIVSLYTRYHRDIV